MLTPTAKILPLIAFRLACIAVSFFSCDDFTNLGLGAATPPEKPPAENDPKCLSITGSRFEKYYYHIDPDSYEDTVDLSSPSVLGYECRSGTEPASYGFCQVALSGVPLRRFAESASFPHKVSGTVAVSGRAGDARAAYSMPFEKEAALSPYSSYNSMEPLSVLNSFANTPGDLVLAYTGNYGSAARKEEFRIFSMSFSADFVRSCAAGDKFAVDDTEFAVDGIYPVGLTASGSAYVSLVPVKRNFYQYRDFTATFSPGCVIADIKPASIVKSCSYDKDLCALSVVFNDYDYPYIGEVLTYRIGAKEGAPTQSKAIRIEG
jgi:hypothetical protein